jgi:hypothetical protein
MGFWAALRILPYMQLHSLADAGFYGLAQRCPVWIHGPPYIFQESLIPIFCLAVRAVAVNTGAQGQQAA